MSTYLLVISTMFASSVDAVVLELVNRGYTVGPASTKGACIHGSKDELVVIGVLSVDAPFDRKTATIDDVQKDIRDAVQETGILFYSMMVSTMPKYMHLYLGNVRRAPRVHRPKPSYLNLVKDDSDTHEKQRREPDRHQTTD